MPHLALRIGLLAVYAAVSVAGMVLMKGADSAFSLRNGVGFTLYVLGFFIWAGLILRMMPLSQAFPLAAGALMLGSQLAGWLFLKERIGLAQLSGAMLILAGVILVSLTSRARG